MTIDPAAAGRRRSMRIVLIACLVSATLAAQTAAPVETEIEKGRQLLQQGEYFAALKQYQQANQVAGGISADAFLGMALAAQGMKTWKNALDFAQSAVDRAGANARLVARAHRVRGQVFTELNDPPNAEQAYRAALAADPDSNVADLHYGLALALLKQNRDDEAIAELKKEIEIRPHGTTAEEAQTLIANPRRGREKYAPDFSFKSADGQTISLESLRGKIVVLDFCRSGTGGSAVGAVRTLLKDHAGAPLVVVSIGEDEDPRAWQAFADKNAMTWPHALDERGRMARLFDVHALPTFVLLDAEGIERARARTPGEEIDKQIRALSAPK
jgi:tetratricopeptide (TPR) repeat protein